MDFLVVVVVAVVVIGDVQIVEKCCKPFCRLQKQVCGTHTFFVEMYVGLMFESAALVMIFCGIMVDFICVNIFVLRHRGRVIIFAVIPQEGLFE